jgi:hypothetical protein
MANRWIQWQGQYVAASDLNTSAAGLEAADRALAADLGFFGIVVGGACAQAVSPAMSIVLAGPTVAYDQLGQRIYVAASQTIDLSVDYLGQSTTVATVGHSKVLSVFLQFTRNNTQAVVDGETPPQTVYVNQAESYQILVYQGAESASPSRPALLSNGVLLCDVIIAYGQTQVHTDGTAAGGSPVGHDVYETVGDTYNAATSRQQLLFAVPHQNTWAGLMGNGAGLNDIFTSISNEIDTFTAAGVVNYLGSHYTPNVQGTWRDGSYLAPQNTLGDAISDVIVILGWDTTGSNTDGASKVGSQLIPTLTSGVQINAGSVHAQLVALKSAANLDFSTTATWANGSILVDGDLQDVINSQIVGALASTSTGTLYVGGPAISSTTGLSAVAAGTLSSQLNALKSSANIDSTAYSAGGAIPLNNSSVQSNLIALAIAAAPRASPTFTGTVTVPAPTISSQVVGPSVTGTPSITRVQQGPWCVTNATYANGGIAALGQVTANAGDSWGQQLDLPHGCAVSSIKVNLASYGGPGAATQAQLKLIQISALSQATTILGTVSDSYNAADHDLTLTVSTTVDRSQYFYVALFVAESGSGAASRGIAASRVTFTLSTMDIAAA